MIVPLPLSSSAQLISTVSKSSSVDVPSSLKTIPSVQKYSATAAPLPVPQVMVVKSVSLSVVVRPGDGVPQSRRITPVSAEEGEGALQGSPETSAVRFVVETVDPSSEHDASAVESESVSVSEPDDPEPPELLSVGLVNEIPCPPPHCCKHKVENVTATQRKQSLNSDRCDFINLIISEPVLSILTQLKIRLRSLL